MKQKLTAKEQSVIIDKRTEKPFTGEYYDYHEKGFYSCKQCGIHLYNSQSKFDSGTGWPSFESEVHGAVKQQPDGDGKRTEIICNQCGGHLGHVFIGEGYTPKNVRHCVNSISLDFIPDQEKDNLQKAIFGGGCFWGVQYHFEKARGVLSTQVGFCGGDKDNPTYKEVCNGKTGHIEAVEVIFNTDMTSYETLMKLFFEIHDPTQVGRQGPDIGERYKSVVFFQNHQQKETTEWLIATLESKGMDVTTELYAAGKFWVAEDYHQLYYEKTRQEPHCHTYVKRF